MSESNLTQKETWRSIPGYENRYEVSDMGRVRSFARGWDGKIRTPVSDGRGYLTVVLAMDRKRRSIKLHQIVMLAFVGSPPDGFEINHKNGSKADCRLENLEYVTHSENIQHAFDTGLEISMKGERHHQHKLTEAEAREVFALCKTMKQRDIAARFGISQIAVSKINRKVNWKHIHESA